MPLSFLALALVLVLVLCFATEVGSVQQTDACIALNFRAAALQGSDDACILLRTIVGSGVDIWRGMRRTSMRRALWEGGRIIALLPPLATNNASTT